MKITEMVVNKLQEGNLYYPLFLFDFFYIKYYNLIYKLILNNYEI